MAEFNASGFGKDIYVGANGNMSFASFTENITASANDTVRIAKLPVGTTLHAFRVIHDATPGTANLQMNVVAKDRSVTPIGDPFNVGSSTLQEIQYIKPHFVGDDGQSELTFVTDDDISGELTIQIEFVATGY